MKPGKLIFVVAVVLGAAATFGTPYLRLAYIYTPLGGGGRIYDQCDYIGVFGTVRVYPPMGGSDCTLIRMFPVLGHDRA